MRKTNRARAIFVLSVVTALTAAATTFAGAGLDEPPVVGHVAATPDPVVLGEVVTISNVDDDASRCSPSEGPVWAEVWIYPTDMESQSYFTMISPDSEGNWSIWFELSHGDWALGEWTAEARCRSAHDVEGATLPPFDYHLATFDVIRSGEPPDNAAAAPVDAVRTAPAFTG